MIRHSRAVLFALILPALVLPDGGLFCLCRGSLTRAFTGCCRAPEATIPACCRKPSTKNDAPMATSGCTGCVKLSTGMSQSTHSETHGSDFAKLAALPIHTPLTSGAEDSTGHTRDAAAPDSGGRPPGPERTPPLLI